MAVPHARPRAMSPDRLAPRLALALALAFPLAAPPGALAAQDQEPPASAPAPPPAPKPKLAAWPPIPKELKEQVATDIDRLRKARTPEMGAQAREALLAAGACVVPSLLPALDKETSEDALERVRAVLLALIGEEH